MLISAVKLIRFSNVLITRSWFKVIYTLLLTRFIDSGNNILIFSFKMLIIKIIVLNQFFFWQGKKRSKTHPRSLQIRTLSKHYLHNMKTIISQQQNSSNYPSPNEILGHSKTRIRMIYIQK